MTWVTNKHLLPVYDRPMIHFAIDALLKTGIEDVLVVTGGEHAGDFLKLLRNGKHLGVKHLEYAYQEGEVGIADALSLAEDFADGERICVLLGDNLIEHEISGIARAFEAQPSGARVVLKEVPDPERFGVARFGDGRIVEIVEKPAAPPSRYAVTGIYFYDADVFDICRTLTPSDRGEFEITDVNNAYLQRGDLRYDVLEGWWTDAGTIESLHMAGLLVAEFGANKPVVRDAIQAPGGDPAFLRREQAARAAALSAE
jgi:glucose-1-phosphate thymidylyltransferase